MNFQNFITENTVDFPLDVNGKLKENRMENEYLFHVTFPAERWFVCASNVVISSSTTKTMKNQRKNF